MIGILIVFGILNLMFGTLGGFFGFYLSKALQKETNVRFTVAYAFGCTTILDLAFWAKYTENCPLGFWLMCTFVAFILGTGLACKLARSAAARANKKD